VEEKGTQFYRNFKADKVLDSEGTGLLHGDCPFCNQGGSCFHVWGTKYHCYSCKAEGDPISYLMSTRKCGFSEAVMILAAWIGYEFPLPKSERKDVAEVMDKEASIQEAERFLGLVK